MIINAKTEKKAAIICTLLQLFKKLFIFLSLSNLVKIPFFFINYKFLKISSFNSFGIISHHQILTSFFSIFFRSSSFILFRTSFLKTSSI